MDAFQREDFFRLLRATLTDLRLLQMVGLVDQALACVINTSENDALRQSMAGFVVKHIPVWLAQLDESVKIKVRCTKTNHDKGPFKNDVSQGGRGRGKGWGKANALILVGGA